MAAFFRDHERKIAVEPSETLTLGVENNSVMTTLTPSKAPSVPLEVKSQFDENIIIDEKNWAVTVVRAGWNHGEIILEGCGECFDDNFVCRGKGLWPFREGTADEIREGKMDKKLWGEYKGEYWSLIAHLTGSGNRRFPGFLSESRCGVPKVLIQNMTGKPIKYAGKTQTFSISKFYAREMLCVIQLEKLFPPAFRLVGDSSTIGQGVFPLLYHLVPRQKQHNCISWAREMLNHGGITLPCHEGDSWFTSTKQYTDPLSREKEVITTASAYMATTVDRLATAFGVKAAKNIVEMTAIISFFKIRSALGTHQASTSSASPQSRLL